MEKLLNTLNCVGKPATTLKMTDGSCVMVLPYGGRVLGLFAPKSAENFYWTHPALESVKTARELYESDQWHNSGGDRTWLAPEVDVFLPNFPKLDRYEQPRSLDPGHYRVIENKDGFRLENRLKLKLARQKKEVSLKITKSFKSAPNPLRYEQGIDLSDLEYAGYAQEISLELVGESRTAAAQVGLWNLVQMPHGGDLLLPTFSCTKPRHIFSTVGTISSDDLIVDEHLVRYRMRQKGEHKISLRAAPMTGRAGYLYRSGRRWSLIIRNFIVNPSGEHVDVPWDDANCKGFAVQACNVNSALGAFSELEYHIPAIGQGTGAVRCDDAAQIWAFRGTKVQSRKVAQALLTPKPLE